MNESVPAVVREELDALAAVAKLLEENPYDLPPSEGKIVEELVRLREELPKAKEEDKGALMMQFNQQAALLEQIREARERPQVDPDSPYFAHLRLREEGRERDVFLGKATRIDSGIRIVDWRHAPVSKIFYQYQQGEEYEERLGGRMVEGEVVARRTVTIHGGDLERVEAPEGIYLREEASWSVSTKAQPKLLGGEGAAMRAHSVGAGEQRRLGTDLHGSRRRADKRLPDIAGLIDADQFELITQPSAGFVVIRGTAGSGKTTVALHRIAWLAYQDGRFDSASTLFLVFSPALKDYVKHVLPGLGVNNVQVRTFHEWARFMRTKHFPKLPKKVRDDTPAVVVRLKQHPAMITVLEEQAKRVNARASGEQALDDWMSACTNLALIQEVLAAQDPDAFSEAELVKATTWCRDRFEEIIARVDGDKEIEPEMDAEDDPLLLFAWQQRMGRLRGPKRRPLSYRHIALDEVQDFSPIEVRVLLGCLDKNKSITLAGDTQQHVMRDSGFTAWSDFFRHLGVEGTSVNTLRVAYRSSQEIVSFARDLLGELAEDDAPPLVTRSGPPVELFRFTDHGGCVAFLADALKELIRAEPLASVVVLTPNRNTSVLYHQGLERGEVPRLRRVTKHDFTFAPGVEITEVDQVKGLEFDYVVLVEASAAHYPDQPMYRRFLHVAATRAVHQLWVTTVGSLSPIVREVMDA